MKVYKRKWENIKIGEAFYFSGCEGFGIKIDADSWFMIDSNFRHLSGVVYPYVPFYKFYKLPVAMRKAMEAL